MYSVKEIYYTLQGEGFHTGRPAVFLRFSGCNLWSGLEKDRATAICRFCDTDFWGVDGINGGKYELQELVDKCISMWPKHSGSQPFLVCTGGEPLLQLDVPLIKRFKEAGFYIAIESNGTISVPSGIDWVCISPKAGSEIKVNSGNELKLVYPQSSIDPQSFVHLPFDHFYLQPLDDPNRSKNIADCIDYISAHTAWKLSLQTHKLIGIP